MIAYLVCISLALVTASQVKLESGLAVKEWILKYEKMGGKVYFDQSTMTLGVLKTSDLNRVVDLSRIEPAIGVENIKLQGYQVNVDDLKALIQWKGLKKLSIFDGKNITDDAIASLAKMSQLQSAVLCETSITSRGLSAMAGHAGLEELEISNPTLNYQSESFRLADLPRLRKLQLNIEGVREVRLSSMPKLQTIEEFPSTLKVVELKDLGMMEELNFDQLSLQRLELQRLPKLKLLKMKNHLLKQALIDNR